MNEILSVKKLNKHYKDLHAVKDLDLQVMKGQIFGLLGPNGAGKSTTIECVLGTKKCEYEAINILGISLKEVKTSRKVQKELFKRLGVQFQANFYPDHITVGEMCEMIASLYDESDDWRQMLGRFGLKVKEKALVKDLSGGQRQKLSVLLALVNKPELVFLDELTTGLDPHARREVWGLLKKLNQDGLTIFLTSHYMDEVEYLCDEIAIVKHGEIIERGTPEEIKKRSGQDSLEDAYLRLVGEEMMQDENIESYV